MLTKLSQTFSNIIDSGNALALWFSDHLQFYVAMNMDISQMMVNLSESYDPIMKMLTGIAYVMGMVFAALGVLSLKTLGESKTAMSREGNAKLPIVYFMVAAVFLYFPTAVDTLVQTAFGEETSPISYTPEGTGSILPTDVITSVLRLIQIIGVISFIRGWLLLVQAAKSAGQPVIGKAATHIIGGILAINIVGTTAVLKATFGIG